MALLTAVLLLLVGFILLIKGADFFVDGASSVAKKLRVPSLIIGLTIVAMGTSLPELSVSVTASLNDNNALAISNVIGSNIFNLMVVLGASAAITPLMVSKSVMKRDYPFSLGCAILLLFLGYNGMELGHTDGVILLIIFTGFIISQILSVKKARKESFEQEVSSHDEDDNTKDISLFLSIVYIIGGAAAVKFGGDWVVNAAITIASSFGLSENLIGLTIVACGTSLPELVTSIAAARKNELDMAIGNVVGSNVFNILMILGVAATISPMVFIMENVIDIGVLFGFSVLTWFFCYTKGKLERHEGIIMLICYAIYLVYICNR